MGILVRNFNCRFRTFEEVFDKMEARFGFLGLIRVDWYARNCWVMLSSGLETFWCSFMSQGPKLKFCII